MIPEIPNPSTFENTHPLSSNLLNTSPVMGKNTRPNINNVPHHLITYK